MSSTAVEPSAETVETGDDGEPDVGEDAAAAEGKLFEVPRVGVVVDESDPNVLKVSFAGSVELDRGKTGEVDFYNSLRHGKEVTLSLAGFVSSSKKTHRRDSEGDVDAVVETKTVTITDVSW